ncbi:response regulator [Rummeliibacillus sp. NPDC094406]|uniref:response regulator n=1 Tax=Rummeliibacillus sp. NPDC094406 TaxID=3364511 RepID=UPI0037FC7C5C
MRVLLIDDEELSLEVMEIMLHKIPNIEIVGKYNNPIEALKDLDEVQVDVIFLDMEMPSMHGLEFAEKVMGKHSDIEVLFVTAYPQFALEAFEVNAIDYLLKPVSMMRLQKAINKIEEKLVLYQTREQLADQSKSILRGYFMVSFQLIDYQNNEVKWRTKKVKELFAFLWHNGKNPIHKSLIIEELWPDKQAEKAVSLLHTTIYQLRKTLKEIGVENPITLINDHYKLSVQLEADVLELQEIIQSDSLDSKKVERVIELYSGDYLENDDFIWSIQHQQELKQEVLCYLQKFVVSPKYEKDYTKLVGVCLDKMFVLNPYDDTIMYQLLEYYCELNNTRKVKEVFQVITHRLKDELGVSIPTNIVELKNNYFNKF